MTGASYDQYRAKMVSEPKIRRYFDTTHSHYAVKLLPGSHYVTGDPCEMIVTVLGSCVAACVRDPVTGIGGMNHFMLPQGDAGDWRASNAVMRYGNHAMEVLINALIKTGCPRERLEIKVFGGGTVIGSGGNIGHKNAAFVTQYIRHEGLNLAASDLGGNYGRRIHYFPETGKVQRLLLRRSAGAQLFNEEKTYQTTIGEAATVGDVELFE